MMRKRIDPPHIVALTIVVCAAIAPAFMLWGRTIGEWAIGIAVYTLISAVVISLLVLDLAIVRYDVMALLVQALSGPEIVGSVSRLLFLLGPDMGHHPVHTDSPIVLGKVFGGIAFPSGSG